MRLIEAEQKLLALDQPVLETNDVSTYLNITHSHASKILKRLVAAGKFISLKRGKWATSKQIDPLLLPEYLTSPFPAYISLQTALFYHEMISQIPSSIYAVTLARTRNYNTPIANISVHHVNPEFFFEFELLRNTNIKIATPEKALIDILYFSPVKSKLFRILPELELPRSFSRKKAFEIIKRISSARLKTLVTRRLELILAKDKTD